MPNMEDVWDKRISAQLEQTNALLKAIVRLNLTNLATAELQKLIRSLKLYNFTNRAPPKDVCV